MLSGGLLVMENIRSSPDFLLPAPFKHTVFLTTAMADCSEQDEQEHVME